MSNFVTKNHKNSIMNHDNLNARIFRLPLSFSVLV